MPCQLSAPYSLRPATPEDSRVIARHRVLMFRDMGLLPEEEIAPMQDATAAWIIDLLADGSYVGWIVECGEDIAGGGGVHLRPHGPMPGCHAYGLAAHVANVYIEPEHRRKGLAEALMTNTLEWARANDIKELTLTASEQGRNLYRRLGFVSNTEFHVLKLT